MKRRRTIKAHERPALEAALRAATVADVKSRIHIGSNPRTAADCVTASAVIRFHGHELKVSRKSNRNTVRRKLLAAYSPNDPLTLTSLNGAGVREAAAALIDGAWAAMEASAAARDLRPVAKRLGEVKKLREQRKLRQEYMHGVECLKSLLRGTLREMDEEEYLDAWRQCRVAEVMES